MTISRRVLFAEPALFVAKCQVNVVAMRTCLACRFTKHRDSLSTSTLQMSEAFLQQQIEQAKAAVTKAQAAYDEANDREKAVCAQLLLADQKTLEQLRETELIQLRAAAGNSTCRP